MKAVVEKHLNYRRNGLTESCTEFSGTTCSLPSSPNGFLPPLSSNAHWFFDSDILL